MEWLLNDLRGGSLIAKALVDLILEVLRDGIEARDVEQVRVDAVGLSPTLQMILAVREQIEPGERIYERDGDHQVALEAERVWAPVDLTAERGEPAGGATVAIGNLTEL